MKERLKLHNLRTDHVVIRSELKYLIGAKMVNFKCRVFGGKTAPFPMVRVFRVVRPMATVRVRVEPDPEPTRQFGPVANTIHDAETRYPAYYRELLGIRDAILYWKFNLHRAEQPFLVHTDHATLRWILTQPHLTVRQMDILTVLQNFDWEVKHIPGVKNQFAAALSRRPDFRRERCNVMAMEVSAAKEWIEDIKASIVDDEWFGPIAHSLANPSPRPPPSTASAK